MQTKKAMLFEEREKVEANLLETSVELDQKKDTAVNLSPPKTFHGGNTALVIMMINIDIVFSLLHCKTLMSKLMQPQ